MVCCGVDLRLTRWTLALPAIACFVCLHGTAQSGGQNGAKFEVASVTRSSPDALYTSWSKPGDFEFRAMNSSLEGLLMTAYGITPLQIAKLPGWSDSVHWDIVAKPSGTKPLAEEALQQALQQLLKDRLHLEVHFESRQVKGLHLIAPADRSGLKPSTGGTSGHTEFDEKGFRAHNLTMQQLVRVLEIALREQNYESFVENETNIAGSFDIRLNYAQKDDDPSPTLFDALQQQLRLRLVPGNVSVQMLVVDHIDRDPTPN